MSAAVIRKASVGGAAASVVGGRIKALRDAMGFSLRDLAERSGVSAPTLSQVERGETSPTLAVAEKIAAGLELTLSQLLRLDEAEHVVVVRAGATSSRSSPRRFPANARTSPSTRWPQGPRPGAPTSRRCRSRVAGRPR